MLLVVETSTARSSVALADADGVVLAAAELGRDRRHGEFVAPAIAQLLHHLGAGIRDVAQVAAGVGPGLYTGLRVGLVTAATIATTHELPCVGVVGTAAIAHALRHTEREVVVVLDARRRELYLARHGRVERPSSTDVEVLAPAAAATRLRAAGGRVLLAGDGVDALRSALADDPGDAGGPADSGDRSDPGDASDPSAPVDPGAPAGHGRAGDLDVAVAGPAHAHPTATMIVPLALRAFADGLAGGPEVLRPLYLREADARIGWSGRGRLQGGDGAP